MGHVRAADRVDLLFPLRNRVNPVFAWVYYFFLYSSDTIAIREERNLVKSVEKMIPYYLLRDKNGIICRNVSQTKK